MTELRWRFWFGCPDYFDVCDGVMWAFVVGAPATLLVAWGFA